MKVNLSGGGGSGRFCQPVEEPIQRNGDTSGSEIFRRACEGSLGTGPGIRDSDGRNSASHRDVYLSRCQCS